MANIYNVNPKMLKKWVSLDEVVLIDVREPAEYKAESIENAKNFSVSQVTVDNVSSPEYSHKKL